MVGPRADDLDRRARTAGGLERDVQALVAEDLRDDQQRVAGLAGGEAMGLHGRVDDDGVAPVVALDSLAAELGDGDIGVDAAAGGEVPRADPRFGLPVIHFLGDPLASLQYFWTLGKSESR